MTGRIPKAWIPAARKLGADPRAQPAPSRRDWDFRTALWEIVVTMGGAFVPLPVELDDDSHDSGDSGDSSDSSDSGDSGGSEWSDAR